MLLINILNKMSFYVSLYSKKVLRISTKNKKKKKKKLALKLRYLSYECKKTTNKNFIYLNTTNTKKIN